jgi:hypothetical protein
MRTPKSLLNYTKLLIWEKTNYLQGVFFQNKNLNKKCSYLVVGKLRDFFPRLFALDYEMTDTSSCRNTSETNATLLRKLPLLIVEFTKYQGA